MGTTKKALQVGDKVLVRATITAIPEDSDPHDPTIVVWFNGNAHETTVMNVRRDTEGEPIMRFPQKIDVPITIPRPVREPNRWEQSSWNPVLDSGQVNIGPDDLVADIPRGSDDVEELLNLVKTPTDEDKPDTTGRIAPPNQHMVFDGRRGANRRGRSKLFAVSNDTDEPSGYPFAVSNDTDDPYLD